MSEGAVYIAFGKRFLAEAEAAAASLRKQMPSLEICLIGDVPPRSDLFARHIHLPGMTREEFGERAGWDDPPAVEWALYNKLCALEQAPYERTLYVDADTYCAAPVHEMLDALAHADTAIALAPLRPGPQAPEGRFLPALNAGIIALRGAGQLAPLFTRWRELYFTGLRPDPDAQYGDQAWLVPSLLDTHTSTCVLPVEFNYRISAVSHLVGPVRFLHGRPKNYPLEEAAAFVNAVHVPRLHLPRTGMFWQEGGEYLFAEAHKPFDPIRLTRRSLLEALRSAATA